MKKEDLNRIAALEKAIGKKYGQEATHNPARHWDEEKEKEYLEQLKEQVISEATHNEKVKLDGFFVSKKLVSKDINRKCLVCETYSFDAQDDVYMSKFNCCYKCYIEYVEGREARWNSGWRPKED